MRTVTFQSVFDAILRRHGFDPTGDAVNHDTARAIVEHINNRVNTAWQMWDWPALARTEERAFRSVWNDTRQFKVAGEDGQPDELYYMGDPTNDVDPGYFRVLADAPSDPPPGTVPTDTDYFEPMETVTPYIGFDQTCRHTIGFVHGIYPSNPSLNGACHHFGVHFRPSEKGVHVLMGCWDAGGTPAATVFVWYALPVSEFTMVPYIGGKTYTRGARVFYPVTGECYRALAESTNVLPTDTDFWAIEPMPDIFDQYVKAGAYSDCLKETFVEGDEQIRLARASLAAAEAQGAIEAEIDLLLAQGQKHFYGGAPAERGGYRGSYSGGGIRVSEPWGGDRVYALAAACEDDGSTGAPVAGESCDNTYHYEIVAIKTSDGTPSLEELATAGRSVVCTLISIVIDVSGSPEEQRHRLDAGPADPDDPGQTEPDDYDPVSNNKHWVKVG